MTNTTHTTLGDLVSVIYEEYLALYGDEELASVAAAATVNDLLIERSERRLAAADEAAA